MATYSQPVHEAIKREIRDLRAIDPLISYGQLQERLALRFNRPFDQRFVKKLADKVARQGLIDADRTKLEERLNFSRENYRMQRERLMQIVYWNNYEHEPDEKRPWASEVTEAAKTIVMLDLALLKAEIDCGLYKKPTEALVREFRYEPLPPELRAVVLAAWKRGGLLPAVAVAELVPEKV